MTDKLCVLFVGIRDDGRSQMAAAFLDQLGQGTVESRSAGVTPAAAVDPSVVEAMREVGIDLDGATPRELTDDIARGADVVVTMGCDCPVFSGSRYLDWALEDPEGRNLAVVRDVRDEIRHRVEVLLTELPIEAT
jgi:arsenate reductase